MKRTISQPNGPPSASAKAPETAHVASDNASRDNLELMPLGAGSEVGRSCMVLRYRGKTIMFDCGVHPAKTGVSALPYFDMIDPAEVDILLVTHFHLDHCAALPYFLQKTTFKGRVFMTHPTKAIYKLMLADFVKVSHLAIEEMLYDEQDVQNSMEKIEPINYHQEVEVAGIRFWAYNAGHVLGAAMFMVEVAGVRILYTGDFSRQEDRHLMAAEIPRVSPDILICESTYGVQRHEPRKAREEQFTEKVKNIVQRGGRCLIPVFALGRAQELLLILDELWHANPALHSIPVFYAGSMAKRSMTIYQTYVNMMNEHLRKQIAVHNPFAFRYISNLKSMEQFEDAGPCVVMASPGMLQSGLSRELFEMWCSDRRNGVIIPGYSVDGTLAKHILSEPKDITTSHGVVVPLAMSVDYISFSAHSDFLQTSEYIDALQPPYVVLVHGEANEMGRLKAELVKKYDNQNVSVFSPKNGQIVSLKFRSEKIAKTVGTLATQTADRDGVLLQGLLVIKDLTTHHLMAPQDLSTYTRLTTQQLAQRLLVPFGQPLPAVKQLLLTLFGPEEIVEKRFGEELKPAAVNGEQADGDESKPEPAAGKQEDESGATAAKREADDTRGSNEVKVEDDQMRESGSSTGTPGELEALIVCDDLRVSLHEQNPDTVVLEWDADPVTDMLADSVIAVLMGALLE